MITRKERQAALERHMKRVERKQLQKSQASGGYWTLKLFIILGGTLTSLFVLSLSHVLGILCALATLVILAMAFINHRKVDKSYLRYRAMARVRKLELARMLLDWEKLPPPLENDETDHPYEIDLDLTGERSLHRLMNTAVSFEGGQRLSDWLLHPTSSADEIRQRQAFVQELVALDGFRHRLLMHSLNATRFTTEQYDESDLLEWLGQEPGQPIPRSSLPIPTLSCVVTILLFTLYMLHIVSPWLVLLPIAFSAIWFLNTQKRYSQLFLETVRLRFAFEQLSEIFGFLETYRYGRNQQLKKLCEPFFTGQRPSEILKKLTWMSRRVWISQNAQAQFVVNALIPLDAYNAYQLNQYKTQIYQLLPQWLEIWFELEALCSVANFAYLNPDYTFPQLLPGSATQQPPTFEARELGHPLIPAHHRIVNDFTLGSANEIELLTGSNMAGKSTFLRTIGINLCLAYAGAPVCASSLRISFFEVYACIKVSDSLADGYSYFYAEVRRLQGLLVRLEKKPPVPIFFLVDEIYKGTNNEERLIGSSAYIHALVGKNCVGAISTHDLELIKLGETLPMLTNYHFREEVKDGRMVFDYKLRTGPCPTRNALKIMELAGLPISWEETPAVETPRL
jgi:hypothetical protein